jgi:hypothetical protein
MLLGLLQVSAALHDQGVLSLVQGGLEIVKLVADAIACPVPNVGASSAGRRGVMSHIIFATVFLLLVTAALNGCNGGGAALDGASVSGELSRR